MKTHGFRLPAVINRILFTGAFAILLLVVLAACTKAQVVVDEIPVPETLTCVECELIDVIEVVDANTLSTSIGDIRLYGAYVLDQPADCASQAQERLRVLAGGQVRIEPGPVDTIRQARNHYYIFDSDGRSIEEQLIREGLALSWSQDGQHVGWFLFRVAAAQENESGCLWRGWQAFQRGEPSEFRIPGLTYPDSSAK